MEDTENFQILPPPYTHTHTQSPSQWTSTIEFYTCFTWWTSFTHHLPSCSQLTWGLTLNVPSIGLGNCITVYPLWQKRATLPGNPSMLCQSSLPPILAAINLASAASPSLECRPTGVIYMKSFQTHCFHCRAQGSILGQEISEIHAYEERSSKSSWNTY